MAMVNMCGRMVIAIWGKWRHSLMKGKGKKLYANGDVYDGKWANV